MHLFEKWYIELLKITKKCNVKPHWPLIYTPIVYKIANKENSQELSLHFVLSNFMKINQNRCVTIKDLIADIDKGVQT